MIRHVSPLSGVAAFALALSTLASCGSDGEADADAVATTGAAASIESESDDATAETADGSEDDAASSGESEESGDTSSFQIEVWADNWMAVYVNGELIGEDSVSITTERSFNSETFSFEAASPFVLAIEAKDFKETDSGLEYIGTDRQQMGDGGVIAQITNLDTGQIVAVTDGSWRALVVHRAPLNTDCETAADPDAECQSEISDTPDGWADIDFDDSGWTAATEWSSEAVDPKQGYDDISWDGEAQFIWGSDLEVDNTVLLRAEVAG